MQLDAIDARPAQVGVQTSANLVTAVGDFVAVGAHDPQFEDRGGAAFAALAADALGHGLARQLGPDDIPPVRQNLAQQARPLVQNLAC